ncbi:MAG: LysM peptidoglycan-binding domain-containing protein [bacterium]|nr:LysM peptidoglycan-binding domain-containing protein [bacterium]
MRRLPFWMITIVCASLIAPVFSVGGQEPEPTPVIHTVRSGETLATIASRYNTTVRDLIAANPRITNPNVIYLGQEIVIPPGSTVANTPGADSGTPTPTAAAQTPAPDATITPVPTLTPLPTNTPFNPDTAPQNATPIPPINAGVMFETGGTVYALSYPERMIEAGMTWMRSQIRWNAGDPVTAAQGAIEAARAWNFKVVIHVTGIPAQLGADPAGYTAQFAAFLGQVAALGPDAIEVWDAPNSGEHWPLGLISPAAYTDLLRAAFESIKRANERVTVISAAPVHEPAFTGRCDANGCERDLFIQGMAAAGAGAVADCIGIRYTEGAVPPDSTTGDSRGAAAYFVPLLNGYAAAFPDKRLCITEIGYLSGEGLPALPPSFAWAANTTVDEQAAWLHQAAGIASTTGRVGLFLVYNVDASAYTTVNPLAGWAIVRPDGRCAYCQAAR